MGNWHVFKQASLSIWTFAAAAFLIPLFHHLFPSQRFQTATRLPVVSCVLTYLRLAWNQINDEGNEIKELRHQLTDLPFVEVRKIFPNHRCRKLAKNLVFLLDVLIPLVNSHAFH